MQNAQGQTTIPSNTPDGSARNEQSGLIAKDRLHAFDYAEKSP
jgi:hypothetical protein